MERGNQIFGDWMVGAQMSRPQSLTTSTTHPFTKRMHLTCTLHKYNIIPSCQMIQSLWFRIRGMDIVGCEGAEVEGGEDGGDGSGWREK